MVLGPAPRVTKLVPSSARSLCVNRLVDLVVEALCLALPCVGGVRPACVPHLVFWTASSLSGAPPIGRHPIADFRWGQIADRRIILGGDPMDIASIGLPVAGRPKIDRTAQASHTPNWWRISSTLLGSPSQRRAAVGGGRHGGALPPAVAAP